MWYLAREDFRNLIRAGHQAYFAKREESLKPLESVYRCGREEHRSAPLWGGAALCDRMLHGLINLRAYGERIVVGVLGESELNFQVEGLGV